MPTSALLPAMPLLLMACASVTQAGDHPSFAGLAEGRDVWLGNCETCHAYGIAGAPIPSEPDDWAERLGKPVETLYDHALNGFIGPEDTAMPARGGNDALSDAEVTAAVDYMRAYARAHQPR